MSKIPTAEEFFTELCRELESDIEDMPEWMIEQAKEFARLHVKAALENAAEKSETLHVGNGMYLVDKESILSAYSESNII